MRVAVIDAARFPRDKICAGWVTPGVLTRLELTPAELSAHGLTVQPIAGFKTSLVGGRPVCTDYGADVSYGIRRREFDAFLLKRSGATVVEGDPRHVAEPGRQQLDHQRLTRGTGTRGRGRALLPGRTRAAGGRRSPARAGWRRAGAGDRDSDL
jgi:flavin-dependent dehydrogenase